MLFNISWWGGLYIIFVCIFLFLEFIRGGGTEDEDTDTEEIEGDEDESMSTLECVVRIGLYIALIAITILFFQSIENKVLTYIYFALAVYVTLICLYYLFDEVKTFVKDPKGEEDLEEGEEPTGVFFNFIGYCIPITLYAGGLAFAVLGCLKLI